jgi:hypothetical protein
VKAASTYQRFQKAVGVDTIFAGFFIKLTAVSGKPDLGNSFFIAPMAFKKIKKTFQELQRRKVLKTMRGQTQKREIYFK